MKTCSLDKCEIKHATQGFCDKHYSRWKNMMNRCNNPSRKDYRLYGLRGIFVCLGWSEHASNYLNDVGDTPFKSASIDRPNNDKGYTCGHCLECIENCWPKNWRWATQREQVHNRRPYKEIRGTTRIPTGYQAQIWIGNKDKYLGSFKTEEEAHQAYLIAKKEIGEP